MSKEEKAIRRAFVIELTRELFSTGNFNHMDAYGGATLAIDLEESMEKLFEKGWKLTNEEFDG